MTDRTRELECVIADLTREAKELRAELEALKRQDQFDAAQFLAVLDREDWRTAKNRAELRAMLAAAPQPERKNKEGTK